MKSEKKKRIHDEAAPGRREALVKAGKVAAYAAPFTVLALSNKAEAATSHGPGRNPGTGSSHARR